VGSGLSGLAIAGRQSHAFFGDLTLAGRDVHVGAWRGRYELRVEKLVLRVLLFVSDTLVSFGRLMRLLVEELMISWSVK
jgi:hypothetical protein